jgi:carboxypeptidase Q
MSIARPYAHSRARCVRSAERTVVIRPWRLVCGVVFSGALAAGRVDGQGAPSTDSLPRGFPIADAVAERIYGEGMHHSHAAALAQVLVDSIGPRLTGSPANLAAHDWLVRTYASWGIPAQKEQYGTWRNWSRGSSQLTLVVPRFRVLEATQLAWSPSTPAGGITGDVVLFPSVADMHDSAGFARWLTTVRGKLVLLAAPQSTCRPDTSWKAWASPASYAAIRTTRDSLSDDWNRRYAVAGGDPGALRARLGAAGAAGILTSLWSRGWGVDKIMSGASSPTAPIFDVSCEDYSLLVRLVLHGQHPRVHAIAESRVAPTESPVYNTIAEIKGSEHADQYVMLSAHLD